MPNYVVRHSHRGNSGNARNSVSRYTNLASQIAKAAGRSYRVIHQHMNKVSKKRSSSGPKSSKKKAKKGPKGAQVARGLEISQHNDLSSKKVHCLYHPKKGIASKKFMYQYMVSKSGIITTHSGAQAVNALNPMLTRPQLNGETGSGASLRTNELWDTDPFLLNPYSTPPGNTIYTTAIPAAGYMSSDMIKVHSLKNEISLMNMETCPVTCSLYWLMCRRNSDASPTDLITTCIADENYRQVNASATAALGGTVASGGIPSLTAYNFNPFQLRDFRKYWKTIGSTKFVLQPGDQRNLYINVPFNKLVTKRFLASGSGNTGTCIQGLTIYPFLIVRAGMVGVSADAATASADVTFGPVKVGVINTTKYNFLAVQPARFKVNREFQGTLENAEGYGTQKLKIIDDVDHSKEMETA